MVTTTRQPYAYVADNPLNASDPAGLCGVLMNLVFGALCEAEAAIAQSGAHSKAGAQAAAAMAQGTGAVHDGVWQHVPIGGGYCYYGCGSATFQSGQLSFSGGGIGFGKLSGWAGVAGKQANQRHSRTLNAGGMRRLYRSRCSGYGWPRDNSRRHPPRRMHRHLRPHRAGQLGRGYYAISWDGTTVRCHVDGTLWQSELAPNAGLPSSPAGFDPSENWQRCRLCDLESGVQERPSEISTRSSSQTAPRLQTAPFLGCSVVDGSRSSADLSGD
jgi:hypothetical protein